jgi:hypothetical protein
MLSRWTKHGQVGDFIIEVIEFVVEIVTLVCLYAFISQVALGKKLFWVVILFRQLRFLSLRMVDVIISDATFRRP